MPNSALGRSRGGLSTKIHLAVDGQGRPVRILLTGGQRNDITQASALLAGLHSKFVLADKGYDSRDLVQQIRGQGSEPVRRADGARRPRVLPTGLPRSEPQLSVRTGSV